MEKNRNTNFIIVDEQVDGNLNPITTNTSAVLTPKLGMMNKMGTMNVLNTTVAPPMETLAPLAMPLAPSIVNTTVLNNSTASTAVPIVINNATTATLNNPLPPPVAVTKV